MSNPIFDYAIVGGGIVGLSTALALTERFPRKRIVLLEKEQALAAHQTGHNSGVIHSGIYYAPGSFKARFARAGNLSMQAFCQAHGIDYEMCGKVIVATRPQELPLLETLRQRGLQNELAIEQLNADQLREIEPHVNALAALRVPSAGIVNYTQVCETLARLLQQRGGEIRLGTPVERIDQHSDHAELIAPFSTTSTRFLINCAGLHSDRITRLARADAGLQIVPFRGEYFELKPSAQSLVKHLIYPVPNPSFPFLGVHFTRMIGGGIEAGPNAVLALAREGYRKTDVNLRDLAEVLAFPGFRKLARRYWREGAAEMWRSMSKAAFVRSLQQLIPAITADDLQPAAAGIRAQALKADGSLVDDFHVVPGERSIHVCNAPSPAATASLEIGRYVAAQVQP